MRIDMEQRIKRDRDFSVTKLTYGTIEALDGQVLRLDTLIDAGEQRIRTHGDVIRGQMELILESKRRQTIGGHPMGPGRSRPLCRRAEHGSRADEGARDRDR